MQFQDWVLHPLYSIKAERQMHRCQSEPWEMKGKSNAMGLAMVRMISSRFRHQQQWVFPLLQPWTQLDDESLSNINKRERKRATKEEQNISFSSSHNGKKNMKRIFHSSSLLPKIKMGRCKERSFISLSFWRCQKQGRRRWNPLSLSFIIFSSPSLSISRPWQKVMGKWQN